MYVSIFVTSHHIKFMIEKMIRLLTRSTRIYSTNPLLKREIAEEVLYIKKHEKESLEKLLKTLSERKEGENEMLAKEEDVSVSLSIELTSTNEKTGESKKQVIDAMYGSVNGNVTGTIGYDSYFLLEFQF